MKVKTSITLPDDLIREIDSTDDNRSAFLERAARQYLKHLAKAVRQANDAAILDKHAVRLNDQAADVLQYQGIPE